MSHTNAKRSIFNMSDKEIVDDLKQQKMEKVVMQELQDSPVVIKKSGLFTDIDNRFGEPEAALLGAQSGATEGGGAPPAGGAGGMPPAGGAPAGGGMPPAGGAPAGGAPAAGGLPPMAENKSRLTEKEYNTHVEKLVYGDTAKPEVKKKNGHKEAINENDKINTNLNKNAQNMIDEINVLLEGSESINAQREINETEDIVIDDIENIELTES
jgi:predicted  nucleic acid-binding Zn-ribbon protein